jgi:hypothetical protein
VKALIQFFRVVKCTHWLGEAPESPGHDGPLHAPLIGRAGGGGGRVSGAVEGVGAPPAAGDGSPGAGADPAGAGACGAPGPPPCHVSGARDGEHIIY